MFKKENEEKKEIDSSLKLLKFDTNRHVKNLQTLGVVFFFVLHS